MSLEANQISELFKGNFFNGFFVDPAKIFQCQSFLFLTGTVCSMTGIKTKAAPVFSEVDSMGTNLLRFNYYLRMKQVPVVAIVSGEKNTAAFKFAAREHFDAVYYKMADKIQAFEHLCNRYSLDAAEIVWVFDDVPDLSFARKAGLRIMVSRTADPLLPIFVKRFIILLTILPSSPGGDMQ